MNIDGLVDVEHDLLRVGDDDALAQDVERLGVDGERVVVRLGVRGRSLQARGGASVLARRIRSRRIYGGYVSCTLMSRTQLRVFIGMQRVVVVLTVWSTAVGVAVLQEFT